MILTIFAETTAQGKECIQDLCETGLPKVVADGGQAAKIVQMILAVMGLVALIYIIIAGFQMITSLGNHEALAKLRQSIIYAAVGLLIILSAEVIIALLISRL